ncbi:MAG: protein kinase [Oscillospiraceae bacterium]|nr:protein kinase [Oscillospiraceae bacterium]MBQ7143758.1 protein kinase [Oscillospiraceae bacterium]
MSRERFDPDNTLAGGLYGMTAKEAVALAIGLCEAVEQSVGADGVHGCVWPGNITAVNGGVAVGPSGTVEIRDMSPDEMEFVSPEQFWSGTATAASDVYSIGLVLYTALNKGIMPWFASAGEHKPDERAAALQSRMKGKELPAPSQAGAALTQVVLKALAFQAEDRYPTPGAFKAALLSLPESDSMAAVIAPPKPGKAPNYSVDKSFEPTPKPKEKKPKAKKEKGQVNENMDAERFRKSGSEKPGILRWIVPILLLAVIIVALILLLRGCQDGGTEFPITSEDPNSGIHEPVPDTPEPGVTATPEPTETPAPTETPEPTPTPEPRYELVMGDVSWTQAKALAEAKGGHLATVRSADELQKVIAAAEAVGARFVWLGAYRGESGNWYYVTGDAMEYAVWDTGEPSAIDQDGTHEDYLLLWYRTKEGRWSYNDMRDDPVSLLPVTYHGYTAYMIQYD